MVGAVLSSREDSTELTPSPRANVHCSLENKEKKSKQKQRGETKRGKEERDRKTKIMCPAREKNMANEKVSCKQGQVIISPKANEYFY